MKAIGYVRVSTDRQAEQGVSLEAQEAKIRAMATVQGAELLEVIIDGGESAKKMNHPGLQRMLALVDSGKVEAVIIAKLDGLTRSVKDLCSLLELFEKRGVAFYSIAESLDTASAAGRLVITTMAAVSSGSGKRLGNGRGTRCDISAPVLETIEKCDQVGSLLIGKSYAEALVIERHHVAQTPG